MLNITKGLTNFNTYFENWNVPQGGIKLTDKTDASILLHWSEHKCQQT